MSKPETHRRSTYHHGNLVEALIDATVALIEERGAEAVSVREVARQAGVSPAAPFRHFKSKTALMTAVAEQAMARLKADIDAAMAATGAQNPLETLRAMGRAYLRWALKSPTHFAVISSRSLIDFHGSERLTVPNEEIRQAMVALLQAARTNGLLRPEIDIDSLVLSLRAYAYGLARMAVDGHFPEWHRGEPAALAVERALDLYIDMLARDCA